MSERHKIQFRTPTREEIASFTDAHKNSVVMVAECVSADSEIANLEWRVVEAAVAWVTEGGCHEHAAQVDPLIQAVDALITAREAEALASPPDQE